MHVRVEVVAAVIRHEGRVLACRRAHGRADAGRWEFPGGKVEQGETPEAALEREIVEELGVTIEVHALIDRSVTTVGGIGIDLSCYWAAASGPLPTTSSDHDAMRWLTQAELHDLNWAIPDLPAVEKLAATAKNYWH